MKKLKVLSAILLLVLMVPLTASAQGPSTYWSGIQIQNQSNQSASIVVTYYNQDGSVATTHSDTIAADDSVTYGTVHPADGFNGSVVISSDQPVVAISNLMGDGLDFGSSYGGFSAGATSVNLPLIMRDNYGYSTWFNVQNTGSNAATVNISYSNGATEGPVTVQPGAAYTFNQADNTDLPSGFSGSASVSSSEPVAVTVVETGATTLFAYNGFTSSATKLSMPLVQMFNWGYITGVQIMNTGSSATSVTLSYTPSTEGTACTETKTIQPNKSETFVLDAFTASGGCGTATFVGSAEVTNNSANQPLVAIVNQLNSGDNKGAAYAAFDPSVATGTVNLPLIMDRNFGYFTGFSVANVGSSATTVTVTCSGSSYSVSDTLNPGEALSDVQLNKIADGYSGSCTAVASGGDEKIVAVVNELNSGLGGDAFLVYEGFSK